MDVKVKRDPRARLFSTWSVFQVQSHGDCDEYCAKSPISFQTSQLIREPGGCDIPTPSAREESCSKKSMILIAPLENSKVEE
jgi:hypothetical protein